MASKGSAAESIVPTPPQTWSKISEQLAPPTPVGMPCARALGHVLAAAVRADRDLPPKDRSSTDGHAVRIADLSHAPVTLSLVGEIPAGSPATLTVLPATCARIFTGVNLPPGADTGVKLEDTQEAVPGRITCRPCERIGANIVRHGENAKLDAELLPAGTLFDPAAVGLCAAVGSTQVRVFRKPTVALVATGRALCDASDEVAAHRERDSDGPMRAAAIASAGFEAVSCHQAPDERAAVAQAIRAVRRDANVVVTSGGVSVGAYDFVPAPWGTWARSCWSTGSP